MCLCYLESANIFSHGFKNCFHFHFRKQYQFNEDILYFGPRSFRSNIETTTYTNRSII